MTFGAHTNGPFKMNSDNFGDVCDGEEVKWKYRKRSYVASMVGAREQLCSSHSGDVVESRGLLAAAVRRSLQHVHQVGDEEVIL